MRYRKLHLERVREARDAEVQGDTLLAMNCYFEAIKLRTLDLERAIGEVEADKIERDISYYESRMRDLAPQREDNVIEGGSKSMRKKKSKTSIVSDVDYTSEFSPTELNTTFADIAGMDELKQDLTENVIWPLIYPDVIEELSGMESNSVLLYGPPGCGKTFIAKSLAGEASKRSGQEINMYKADSSSLENRYVGDTSKLIKAYFQTLLDDAPSIGFIDEIEGLCSKRGGSGSSRYGDKIVDCLLEGWNTIDESQAMIIATSNLPWTIDAAILRSGRLEDKIFVPAPDFESRVETFEVYLGKKKIEDIDFDELANLTDCYSNRAIRKVAVLAGRIAAGKTIKGERNKRVITMDDLIQAITETPSDLKVWADQTINSMVANTHTKNPRLRSGISGDFTPVLQEAVRIRDTLENRLDSGATYFLGGDKDGEN